MEVDPTLVQTVEPLISSCACTIVVGHHELVIMNIVMPVMKYVHECPR